VARYLFTYSGQADPPAEHIERIGKHGKIIDRTLQTYLVDTPPAQVPQLASALPGWKIEPEQTVPVPDTRKRLKGTGPGA
jgi:hypothetical protein